MSDTNESQSTIPPSDSPQVSPDTRGGPWLPVVLAVIGVSVVLSGIFSGAAGIYGDVDSITWSDGFKEAGREFSRLALFSLLLLAALRIYCWKIHRPLGGVLLAALRCLAIIALVEAVRVVQIPHGIMRIILIIVAQYIVCSIGVLALFSMTIRETIFFVSWCTAGAALLWVGAFIGIWMIFPNG
jgi:hypothetical protein